MRFIITAQAATDDLKPGTKASSGLGTDDVLEIRQLTGAGDIPPEVLEIIRSAAPTWSASVWQARE
jgi:hypothetical protein